VLLSIFGGLEELNPLLEIPPTDLADLIKVETAHIPALLSYNASQLLNIETGGDQAYDEEYWQARAPRTMLKKIAANGIPAFMVDGWNDLYQRGAPMNYAGLQNAFAGRPVDAAMTPRQRPTGRYQLLQGPWYHLDAGTGIHIYELELKWFERWLRDAPTGIDRTSTPLHVYDMRAHRWVDAAHYPFSEAHPQTLYFAPDGGLSPKKPTEPSASDQLVFTAASSPCTRQTQQWSMGAVALGLEEANQPPGPCDEDDRTLAAGPGAKTYTTPPLAKDTVVAGPIDATVYATSNRPEVELVATIEDVAPDGASKPLTSGALLGTFRALDPQLTWLAADGRPMHPYHPYTRLSVQPVKEGELTRYDIEVFPIFAQIAAGHSLRLTLTSSDTPHLLPTAGQATMLAGGVYDIHRDAKAASFLEVQTAAPAAFRPCTICR
jgi:putative CocE/NonD family hydrolase